MHTRYTAFPLLLMFLFLLFLINCNEKESPAPQKPGAFKNGVFIINEGVFRWNNASLSFYNEKQNQLTNRVFEQTQGSPLGDVAQSAMLIRDSLLFIVVNNSGKIEVLNTQSGNHKGTITNLPSPRYLEQITDSTLWITDFKDTKIRRININTLKVTGSIETGKTTEAILKHRDNVFVTNWSGGQTVQVIDAVKQEVKQTLHVHKEPNSMAMDASGSLWILCSGGFNPSTAESPALFQVNTQSLSLQDSLLFNQEGDYPTRLTRDAKGRKLYYLNGGVYTIQPENPSLPQEPLIKPESRVFYGLHIHQQSGKIWVSDAKDYVQRGTVFIYGTDGTLHNNFTAGIIPSAFALVD